MGERTTIELGSSAGSPGTLAAINNFDSRMWGTKADGVTDDSPALQAAINYVAGLGGGTLFIKNTGGVYLLNLYLILNGKVRIHSDGAVLKLVQTWTGDECFFVLHDSVSANTDIEIIGINTIGLTTSQRFIRNSINGAARKTIARICIRHIISEVQPVAIDFNAKKIELRDILTGNNLTSSIALSSYISIVEDETYSAGESIIMDNCYVFGGNQDRDMFSIKGFSYTDVRLSNLTANSLASIVGRTGDGFDMDRLGKNAVIYNIRAIRCGIEIKRGGTGFNTGTRNLTANLLTCIDSPGAGISCRASGNYDNLLVINPQATGLVISSSSEARSDGSSNADDFINIGNVDLIHAGTASYSMVAISLDNVNIKSLNISNEFGSGSTPLTEAVRLNTCKNVNIDMITVRGAVIGVSFAPSSVISNLSINKAKFIDITDRLIGFASSGTLTNFSLNDLKFQNYTGSSAITLSSSSFNNIRFNDLPADIIAALIALSGFTNVSTDFLFNNFMYDKKALTTAAPYLNSLFPVGHLAENVTDGTVYMKKNSGAYVQL